MMENTALLVIDMQEGNFTGELPLFRGQELLNTIRELVAKARKSDVSVVYIQNCGSEDDPDKKGTPGWETHSSLAPEKGDIIIEKSTPDAFHETGLIKELEALKARKLIITGLQTEHCIDTTVRRGFSLGYSIVLVEDGHSTYDTEKLTARQIIDHHNAVLGDWFAVVKSSKVVL